MIQEFNNDLIYSIIQSDINRNGSASIYRVNEALTLKGIIVDIIVIEQRIKSLNEKNSPKGNNAGLSNQEKVYHKFRG